MTLRRFFLLIVLAGLAFGWMALLPPQGRNLTVASGAAPLRGTVHVHTRRSDGTGTIDDVAAAATRAGLKFVIVTDHGDGTREPYPPAYRNGVLCIEDVEISTDNGHVVALGLPRAPYPLAGEARTVIEDIARLGGMSLAAHPGSAKPELRWTEWDAPFDGLEWLNGDSEWRDEEAVSLARALLTYPFRPSATMARLLDRPEDVLRQWTRLTAHRRVVAVAASDAHARIGLRGTGDPYRGTAALHIPAYEEVFRSFSIALPDVQLTGDATRDARMVLDAIREGHVYSSVDSLAGPAVMSFSAVSGSMRVQGGDALTTSMPIVFDVSSNAPPEARITLLKDGSPVSTATGSALKFSTSPEPGVFRVEIHLPEAPGDPPVPWVVSNPVYVNMPSTAPAVRPAPKDFAMQYENGPATGWTVETSDRAQGAFDVVPAVGGTQISLRYALSGALEDGPYVALAMPAGSQIANFDRLTFTARAAVPMRVSVQVRVPDGNQGPRWQRSVYVDDMAREITVFFDDMRPVGGTDGSRPVLSNVRSVLFVVDTVNSKPGTSGQLWFDDIRYAR